MKISLKLILTLISFILISYSLQGQVSDKKLDGASLEIDFSDRQAIITATKNFFIGDHTGSIKHKKLSMHEKGAYRFVNREGEYSEYAFDLDSDDSDTSYTEEILGIEIFDKVALVRLRLAENKGGQHYKMLTLHKIKGDWKITTITWGSEITH